MSITDSRADAGEFYAILLVILGCYNLGIDFRHRVGAAGSKDNVLGNLVSVKVCRSVDSHRAGVNNAAGIDKAGCFEGVTHTKHIYLGAESRIAVQVL